MPRCQNPDLTDGAKAKDVELQKLRHEVKAMKAFLAKKLMNKKDMAVQTQQGLMEESDKGLEHQRKMEVITYLSLKAEKEKEASAIPVPQRVWCGHDRKKDQDSPAKPYVLATDVGGGSRFSMKATNDGNRTWTHPPTASAGGCQGCQTWTLTSDVKVHVWHPPVVAIDIHPQLVS
eukprot:s92_g45.t1